MGLLPIKPRPITSLCIALSLGASGCLGIGGTEDSRPSLVEAENPLAFEDKAAGELGDDEEVPRPPASADDTTYADGESPAADGLAEDGEGESATTLADNGVIGGPVFSTNPTRSTFPITTTAAANTATTASGTTGSSSTLRTSTTLRSPTTARPATTRTTTTTIGATTATTARTTTTARPTTTAQPTTTVRPTTTTSRPASNAGTPSDIINMRNWKITLPVSKDDYYGSGGSTAAEIEPTNTIGAEVGGFWEVVEHPIDGDMVRFRVNTGGARTSSGTKYARTELREWVDGGSNYWDFGGSHSLTVQGRVMETPPNRPEVVVAQVKAGSDEAARVEWDGDKGWNLVWDENNQMELGALGYTLGDEFLVTIDINNYVLDVTVTNLDSGQSNGRNWTTGLSSASSRGGYFKAGAYVQSQAGSDDAASAVADVWLSRVELG